MTKVAQVKVSEKQIQLHTAVVGSGAAGFRAVLQLKEYGAEPCALITEGVNMGTSRNTGSDKQTYYKLSLSGSQPDSPAAMARDLFEGQSMDGDLAYAEAAGSAACFLRLAQLGVPFPTNTWGEYVGYRTDHDRGGRASSAGPLTSKIMTECLENEVRKAQIPIYDGYTAVEILTHKGTAVGLLCLRADAEGNAELVVFRCRNIIWATGGPAGIYADSVYPVQQHGSSGVPFLAGAVGKNLTEWQYGLASVAPRWNVSGTYMQVLPRLISVDDSGTEREFLLEHYADAGQMLAALFRKGYEWPFDSRKAITGSSVIDLLVYRESLLRNRRVYLDYRENPGKVGAVDFETLPPDVRSYLKQADACFGTPVERLIHMNAPAYELYRSKGVDLKKQRLEIRLCAQHCNGGLDVDAWWQTSIPHLFAVGEAAGTHGVYRPGGSALNAGQVGAVRAAEYIAFEPPQEPSVPDDAFEALACAAVEKHRNSCQRILSEEENISNIRKKLTNQMSKYAAMLRQTPELRQTRQEICMEMAGFAETVRACDVDGLRKAYQLYDITVAQLMVLAAMENYAETEKTSRGSAIYPRTDGDCAAGLENCFRFLPDSENKRTQVQLTAWNGGQIQCSWRAVRPLPDGGGVFETVWREYRERQRIRQERRREK